VIPFLAALFLLLHLGQWAHLAPTWATSWGDDLLCMPLVLGGILQAQRHAAGRGPAFTLPLAHGLGVLLLFGVFFELVWPRLDAQAVADPYDLAAYALGFVFFQALLNRPARSRPAPA